MNIKLSNGMIPNPEYKYMVNLDWLSGGNCKHCQFISMQGCYYPYHYIRKDDRHSVPLLCKECCKYLCFSKLKLCDKELTLLQKMGEV